MNRFTRMMVARGYWDEMSGMEGAGGAGGSEYTPPEGFSAKDTELVSRGLEEMDDLFGPADENKDPETQVPADKTPADDKQTPGTEKPAETPSQAPADQRTDDQRRTDEEGAHPPAGDPAQMPKSWKAGLAGEYAKLPDAVKAEIHRREENFFKGLEARQPALNFAVEIDKALRPFATILQEQKATPQSAINYLFSAYHVLTKGAPDQRVQAIQHFMKESGVTVEALTGQAAHEQAYEDPAVKTLRDQLNKVQSTLTERDTREQAALRQKAESEFDAFAAQHPDLPQVLDDMVPLIRSGMTLQQAYDKAIWANPVTRELKLKADADAKAEAARKESEAKTQKARNASRTNVRTSSRSGSPTAPLGSIDDTMQEVLANIKARG